MRRVQVRWLPLVTLLLTATVGDVQGQSLKVGEKLEVLEERAHKDSCDAAAQYNVAMGYLSKEKYDAADQALRRAIAIEPQFADAYLALSISRDKDGNYWRKLKKAGKDSVKASVKELEGFLPGRLFYWTRWIDVKIIVSVVYIRPWGDFAKG
jgi:tetratricopeptide (TPR) repeat protein